MTQKEQERKLPGKQEPSKTAAENRAVLIEGIQEESAAERREAEKYAEKLLKPHGLMGKLFNAVTSTG